MDANALLLLAVITSSAFDIQNDATKAARQAYFEQSGLDRTLQDYERRAVSQELRTTFGNIALVSKTLIDRRVTVTWTFP